MNDTMAATYIMIESLSVSWDSEAYPSPTIITATMADTYLFTIMPTSIDATATIHDTHWCSFSHVRNSENVPTIP